MKRSKIRRRDAATCEDESGRGRVGSSDAVQTAEGAPLAIFDVLCADVCEAFADAARRQGESLASAERRLSRLARRCRTTAELDAAAALKGMITQCVADAADENVKIWADLVKRVQDNCARFEAAKSASGADGPGGKAAGRPSHR